MRGGEKVECESFKFASLRHYFPGNLLVTVPGGVNTELTNSHLKAYNLLCDQLTQFWLSKILSELIRYRKIQVSFWIQVDSFSSLRSCVNRLSKEPAFGLLFRLWQLRGRSALHQQMRFARCRIRSIPADDRWVGTQWEIIRSRARHKTGRKQKQISVSTDFWRWKIV